MNHINIILFLFFYNFYAQTTAIPDENFEQALIDLNIDSDKMVNGQVLTSDISDITTLNISDKNIKDLTGIEDFNSLEILNCGQNWIEYLDLSQNLNISEIYCSDNNMTGLNIRNNEALVILECDHNLLDYIDVSQNRRLTRLSCYDIQLETLDVSNNQELIFLNCQANKLKKLDLSNNTHLKDLYCDMNRLTNIDISKCVNLTDLLCQENYLNELNLSSNISLTRLSCEKNFITELDLSENINLTFLSCSENSLEKLDVKNGANDKIIYFFAKENSNLKCIQVDDEDAANKGTGVYIEWSKDVMSTYSEDCSAYLSVDDNILTEGLNIFPNPVLGMLTVDSKQTLKKVEILSILGEKVKEVNSGFNSISTKNLSRGIYILIVFSENGVIARKLIKQ